MARTFEWQQADILAARLTEPRRFLQVVAGAPPVGKTTLVGQVLDRLDSPNVFVSADEPTVGDRAWVAAQWERGRLAAGFTIPTPALLPKVVDLLDNVPMEDRDNKSASTWTSPDTQVRNP